MIEFKGSHFERAGSFGSRSGNGVDCCLAVFSEVLETFDGFEPRRRMTANAMFRKAASTCGA
jgi:hypothetical protein